MRIEIAIESDYKYIIERDKHIFEPLVKSKINNDEEYRGQGIGKKTWISRCWMFIARR